MIEKYIIWPIEKDDRKYLECEIENCFNKPILDLNYYYKKGEWEVKRLCKKCFIKEVK